MEWTIVTEYHMDTDDGVEVGTATTEGVYNDINVMSVLDEHRKAVALMGFKLIQHYLIPTESV